MLLLYNDIKNRRTQHEYVGISFESELPIYRCYETNVTREYDYRKEFDLMYSFSFCRIDKLVISGFELTSFLPLIANVFLCVLLWFVTFLWCGPDQYYESLMNNDV